MVSDFVGFVSRWNPSGWGSRLDRFEGDAGPVAVPPMEFMNILFVGAVQVFPISVGFFDVFEWGERLAGKKEIIRFGNIVENDGIEQSATL